MGFYGCYFSFDDVPCFEYGLMMYDFGSTNESGKFSSPVEIQEDRTSKRYSPLHYGVTQNTPLTFSFTFGADVDAIDKGAPLDRWDMAVIATWLTGHDTYKYLEITQPDMESVRYKCIISNLEYTTYGNMPWAFTCQVICDSPFAYSYPETIDYTVSNKIVATIENRSSCMYYYPKLIIDVGEGTSFSIINHSDNNRTASFSNITHAPIQICIDGENEIITSTADYNIYDCFNFNFVRLVRGNNDLEIIGNGHIAFECEFPINIGG